jgi:TfoX/Sxy family transcriptional regulator of competence genes
MTYDKELERRIDAATAGWDEVPTKKKLFGAVGYLIHDNMAFGIHGRELIVRTTESRGNELLRQPGLRHFAMGGRTSMKNWYLAGGEAIAGDAKLTNLLETCRDYVQTLPPKD